MKWDEYRAPEKKSSHLPLGDAMGLVALCLVAGALFVLFITGHL
jgi:hypothetical protein